LSSSCWFFYLAVWVVAVVAATHHAKDTGDGVVLAASVAWGDWADLGVVAGAVGPAAVVVALVVSVVVVLVAVAPAANGKNIRSKIKAQSHSLGWLCAF
jgi:hypothetical protein